MKICPYCESELSDTARKCKYCGERVNRKGEKDELNASNKNYIPNDIIYEYLKDGFDGMNQIEYITDEQAKILSNFDILSKYKCYELQLNGIKELTDNQMSILSQFQGSSISLNGLTSITDNQLEILSNYKTEKYHPFFTISLNGLKTLTDRQAKILTKFQGHKLCLNGLTSVTDKQIEYFNKFIEKDPYNCNVELQGLKSITDRQSEFFSKILQVVELNNVEYITDKQSEILSDFRGLALSLKGLKKVTNTQISNFGNFKGDFLYYSINGNSVKFVNDCGYGYLETFLNLTNYISDEQFKLFIEKYGGIEVIAKKITDKQAEILSNSDFFKLHDLEELSDKQLKIFSNFKGDYIEIWVEKISEKQKDVLIKSLGDRAEIQWKEIYNDNPSQTELLPEENAVIKVFFFDTETTGKDPHIEQIIQFGGIYGIYDKNTGKFEEKDRINQLVKPSKKIPEEASKVHGLRNKDLEGYGFIDEYIYDFLAFIKKADFVVGHNVEYDKTILIAETKRLNIPFDFSKVKWVDTMKPCTSLVKIPAPERSNDKYKWPKLIELYKFLFGKEFDNAHDAMADITATKDCFVELCNKYNFFEDGKFKERLENTKVEDSKDIEDEKPSKIEKVYNEFKELQHITNILGEAQGKVKNVECVYNNETGDVRYKINGNIYSEDDIINIDGYVFLKKIVTKFGGKYLVQSGRYLYNPEDIERTDKYKGIPKGSAKPIACAVYTKYSKELMGYYKPEDVVWVHQGEYFPKKDAIIINFNGKDYYFRNDDDYVFKEYLKKSWSGEYRLKSDCIIVEEKDKNYFWVKKSGIPWEDVLPKIIIIGLIIMVIIYIQKH